MKKILLITALMLCTISFAYAELEPKVEVKVSGMVCDFCAQGLKKTFAKNKAVDKIDVSLEKGLVSIWLKNGMDITEEEIKKAIKDNGISVNSISKINEK